MTFNSSNKEKIYNILRSLFRYSKLVEMQAPEILFANEGKIILERIKELSPEEIFLVITSWEDFCREQNIQDEIQNKQLNADLNLHFQSMN
jgi:hypothetical protein